MNNLKEAALEYAAQGWPIFPVRANKQPYEDTNGVLDATTNKKQIKEWWDTWPKANIALDVGGAQMVVIDLDPGHDMNEIEESIGGLKDTGLIANTPRGGDHLYYTIGKNETIPPSASKIAKAVDIRSFHSYVLLPPSRTKDGVYSWESEGKPTYRADELAEAACEVREKDARWDDWIIDADLTENIAKAVQWLRDKAKPAVVGQGGDQMTYATAAMCKSFGLSPEMAFDLMWEHWCPRCVPPWDESGIETLEKKIVNGYSYNTSPPGNMTEAYKVAKAQELFNPVSRDTKGGGREVKAGRFRFVDREGMEEIKPPEWLIKDAIPQNSYCLLVGPSGTFKTFIALDMALSVATGAPFDPWHGMWPNVSAEGPVLFAVGEGRGNIKNRVQAWEQTHMEGERTQNLILVDPVPSPNVEDVTPFIEAALDYRESYSLVVLDTVGRAMQGLNENSQQDVSMFTRMVETLQHELGCAVLAIHHSGHEHNRARGSSVFGADVDAAFMTERKDKEHIIKLRNTKQKDATEWGEPKIIQLNEVHINLTSTSLVAVAPDKKTETAAQDQPSKKEEKEKGVKIDLQILGKLVHEELKANKARVWKQSELAQVLATVRHEDNDEPILAQGWEAIKKHLTTLRESTHPSHKHFDARRRGTWAWRGK